MSRCRSRKFSAVFLLRVSGFNMSYAIVAFLRWHNLCQVCRKGKIDGNLFGLRWYSIRTPHWMAYLFCVGRLKEWRRLESLPMRRIDDSILSQKTYGREKMSGDGIAVRGSSPDTSLVGCDSAATSQAPGVSSTGAFVLFRHREPSRDV